MGWLITVGILCFLAIIPLGVSAIYDEDGVLVHIVAGPLRFQVVPVKKKAAKPAKKKSAPKSNNTVPKDTAENKKPAQKETPANTSNASQPDGSDKKKKSGGPITDFLPLVKVLLRFLDGFRRKLRVNVLELKLILAADDPCDLAVNYGRAWAAVGNLMPQLERIFVIQKRNIEVECDFTADKTKVLAQLDLTITVGRMLALVFILIVRALVELIKILIKRKGGAVNEPKSS